MLLGLSFGSWLGTVGLALFPQEDPAPPAFAQAEVAAAMKADLQAIRHPLDGSGRAFLVREDSDQETEVGRSGRWVVVWQAGKAGIADEARVFLQVSPFWGWSTPQTEDSALPGWTQISAPEGVDPIGETLDQQLLLVRFRGRGLRAGEELRFEYHGRADRFAERAAAFFVAVDGDGDGVRGLVEDTDLTLTVQAGPPEILHLVLPSTTQPGQEIQLRISALDRHGNLCNSFPKGLALSWPQGLSPGSEPDFSGGTAGWTVQVERAGVFRVTATDFTGRGSSSNPMISRAGVPPVIWADLQVHTAISDGTGALDEVYRYARDVAALDVLCVTDHDHWGMRFLDSHPQLWKDVQRAAESWNQPGEFVALLGFEWTNWIYGHRHVVYGGSEGEVLSSLDERWDTPPKLWAALRNKNAITIAHHSAGGPVAVDWRLVPNPEIEPVTEIVSVHGSSEAPDSPSPIYRPVAGNFVRDALEAGIKFGFLGSTDGHDGHPGLSQLGGASGGLAALLTDDLSRDGVMAALRARRVYATNGPRIILRFSLDDVRMGGEIAAAEDSLDLVVRVLGTAPLQQIDLIRSGGRVTSVSPGSGMVAHLSQTVSGLQNGEWLYIRVIQEDGGAAWSSPIFGTSKESSEGL